MIRGVKAFLDPAIVESTSPTYSTEDSIFCLYFLYVKTILQGIGEPMILCPEKHKLSIPQEKSNLGAPSTKGNITHLITLTHLSKKMIKEIVSDVAKDLNKS